MKRILLCTAVLAGLVATVAAEPIRSILTKENRFPRPGEIELGTEAYYASFDESEGDEFVVAPYLRYGVFYNLALTAKAPVLQVEDDVGNTERGLGDASVGLEFLAYEDIFRYPFIIPYVDIFLPTGDEDKGLGRGETSARIGVAIGTVLYEVLHLTLDVRYDFIRDQDNIPSVAGSAIWDLDRKFSLLAEVEYRDESTTNVFGEDENEPILFLGGFSYRVSDLLSFTLFMGAESNSDREAIGGGKLSLTF